MDVEAHSPRAGSHELAIPAALGTWAFGSMAVLASPAWLGWLGFVDVLACDFSGNRSNACMLTLTLRLTYLNSRLSC